MKPRTDGLYLSPIHFEKYSQELSRECLRFSADGSVEKYFREENAYNTLSILARGTYSLRGNLIHLSLASCADDFKSEWSGIVKQKGIEFRLETPDFEDMGGEYEFEPCEAAEQAGAGQPTTRPVVEPEGGDKPQQEAEGRSR